MRLTSNRRNADLLMCAQSAIFALTSACFDQLARAVIVIFLCVAVQFSTLAVAQRADEQNSYRRGLDAYLTKDYETAKSLWLDAAKQNNARAMFNLGLLHEKKLIRDSDNIKATKWYRLAGKQGYPAAHYHLATLLTGQEGAESSVQSLLESAARNGYEPARKLLRLPSNSVPRPLKKQALLNNVAADEVAPTSSQGARVSAVAEQQYLSTQWIKSQAKSQWTIQMLAFEELAKVKAFIDDHELNKSAAYFTERTDTGVLYKLIYGSYSSKEQADQARQKLSDALKEYGPWLRPIEGVQALLN